MTSTSTMMHTFLLALWQPWAFRYIQKKKQFWAVCCFRSYLPSSSSESRCGSRKTYTYIPVRPTEHTDKTEKQTSDWFSGAWSERACCLGRMSSRQTSKARASADLWGIHKHSRLEELQVAQTPWVVRLEKWRKVQDEAEQARSGQIRKRLLCHNRNLSFMRQAPERHHGKRGEAESGCCPGSTHFCKSVNKFGGYKLEANVYSPGVKWKGFGPRRWEWYRFK